MSEETITRAGDAKKALVNSLKEDLSTAPLIALVNYEKITVEQINSVRRTFEAKGLRYTVVKNTLINLAVKGTDKEDIGQYLKGMTGVIISGEDGVEAAKVIRETTKEFKGETFVLKGGFFDGEVLDASQVTKVADLPSKEELLTMLLRTIQEGPRQVIGVIQGPARDLVNLLKNYENKLSAGE
jgi:large subunit ribosomal protein L10